MAYESTYFETQELPEWVPYVKGTQPNGNAPYAWSGSKPPPAIGDRIFVRMNSLGWAKVVGYAVVDGFLAVRDLLEDPPAWHLKQNGPDCIGCVFGAEIKED